MLASPPPGPNPYAPPLSTADSLPHAASGSPPPLAGLGARFSANLIDQLVVSGPAIALAIVFGVLVGDHDSYPKVIDRLFWVLVLLGGVVQILVQNRFGQSVGKRLLGIRVVDLNGNTPSTFAIVGRALSMTFLFGCAVLSLVDALMIFGPERRCLHDRIAKTRVVRAG